jgi:BMFP domain-containing protein YqiC
MGFLLRMNSGCGPGSGAVAFSLTLQCIRCDNTYVLNTGVTAMTTGPNKIMDDFARLMTDMAGTAQGMRREVETAFQNQAEKFLAGMDLVKREEFEAAREMAAKARDENEALAKRVAELEEKLSKLSGK